MRIQFELGQKSHDRHQMSVLEALNQRGHEVVRTACVTDCPGMVEHRLPAGDHRELLAFSASIRDDQWGRLSYLVRCARDYVRYLRPEHSGSDIIKLRARNMLLIGFDDQSAADARPWLELLENPSLDLAALDSLDRSLEAIETMIPPHPVIVDYVRAINPDVFCVTPMLMTQYGQTELVKAVRSLDIPIVFLAGSWDNLTTKGTTHIVPDLTLVWNDIQAEEAERFHGIPRARVRSVGAPRFDEFWERKVEVGYADHCAQFGFDATRPTITYLGSSNLIVKDEISFISRWIARLRESPVKEVATANILLRPHPKFAAGWKETFENLPNVGLSLSKVLNNDASLFHAMAHSRAVVGANTSAELEAAILGCPVFTIKDPAFVSGQDGTIHFGYLAGDLAKVATSLEEHVAQLAEALSQPKKTGVNDAFLRSFLRPMGLNRRAGDTTADAIEAAGNRTEFPATIAANEDSPAAQTANPSERDQPLRGLLRSIKSTARMLSSGR